MLRHVGRDLRESGDEARVAHELRGDAMVGVTAFERRRDHDARREAPDHARERLARRRRVLDAGIGKGERLARAAAENLRGLVSLRCRAVSAEPRVPISPCVRSRIAVRCPSFAALISVPPQVSSTSSRWAAMARMNGVSEWVACAEIYGLQL